MAICAWSINIILADASDICGSNRYLARFIWSQAPF